MRSRTRIQGSGTPRRPGAPPRKDSGHPRHRSPRNLVFGQVSSGNSAESTPKCITTHSPSGASNPKARKLPMMLQRKQLSVLPALLHHLSHSTLGCWTSVRQPCEGRDLLHVVASTAAVPNECREVSLKVSTECPPKRGSVFDEPGVQR